MKQSTIDIEADAGRLLHWLTAFEQLSRVAIINNELADAAAWLVEGGYAHWGKADDWFYISGRGRDHYDALCRNPSVTASPAAWKEEARSGMAVKSGPMGSVTRQSEIDRAVIPSPSPPRTPKSPEDVASHNEAMTVAKNRWLAKFGCSEDELHQYGMDGRLRYCEGHGDVGVFDRDRDGWKSLCRACRKGRR